LCGDCRAERLVEVGGANLALSNLFDPTKGRWPRKPLTARPFDDRLRRRIAHPLGEILGREAMMLEVGAKLHTQTLPNSGKSCNPILGKVAFSRFGYAAAMTSPLQIARETVGLSREALAEMAGGISASQITKLERGERRMSVKWAKLLAPHLNATPQQLMGISDEVSIGMPPVEPDQLPMAISKSVTVVEYDVRPSAGGGADMPELDGAGEHSIVARWEMPRDYLVSYIENPAALRIVRVAGDSMEPEYAAGERVIVDTSHRTPSPSGVYVLWDGFGLIIKRLDLVPGFKEPRMVRIMAINPDYAAFDVPLHEIRIAGRVIGKWVWK
jgi:DNA-binding XRE family transcriptional regulator